MHFWDVYVYIYMYIHIDGVDVYIYIYGVDVCIYITHPACVGFLWFSVTALECLRCLASSTLV